MPSQPRRSSRKPTRLAPPRRSASRPPRPPLQPSQLRPSRELQTFAPIGAPAVKPTHEPAARLSVVRGARVLKRFAPYVTKHFVTNEFDLYATTEVSASSGTSPHPTYVGTYLVTVFSLGSAALPGCAASVDRWADFGVPPCATKRYNDHAACFLYVRYRTRGFFTRQN